MLTTEWRMLGRTGAGLRQARIAAHRAVQWTSRAARAALEPVPDDSHTNLGWDRKHQALTSHPLRGARLGLRVADRTLLRIGPRGIDDRFCCAGRSEADAGRWTDAALHALGIDRAATRIELPYEMPVADEAAVTSDGRDPSHAALEELAAWFATADDALQAIAIEFESLHPGPSPVRCWPHHFDLATLIGLEEGDSETARAIGVGLSPGDEHLDQPYFYVNPWPQLDPDDLPDLLHPGQWHTEGFVGAVAPAKNIVGLRRRREETLAFLRHAIERTVEADVPKRRA